MKTPANFGDILRHVGNCYPEFPLNADVIDAYAAELSGFSNEHVAQAASGHIKNKESFPRVCDLFQRLKMPSGLAADIMPFIRVVKYFTGKFGVEIMVMIALGVVYPKIVGKIVKSAGASNCDGVA